MTAGWLAWGLKGTRCLQQQRTMAAHGGVAVLLLLLFFSGRMICDVDAERGAAGRPPRRCTHDITQADRCMNSACVAPVSAAPQGSGWLQGDFLTVAYRGSRATLSLALNTTAGTPPLTVDVASAARGLRPTSAELNGTQPVRLALDIAAMSEGQHAVRITPDSASRDRGWCGELVRFLRKAAPASRPSPPSAAIPLRLGQPVLFFDEFFVASRQNLSRRLVPAIQSRISNDSFCVKPHPWMKVDRGLTLTAAGRLDFGMRVDYASATSPLANPASEGYDCSGQFDTAGRPPTWSCARRPSEHDGLADVRTGKAIGSDLDSSSNAQVPANAWPPPAFPNWPLPSTAVRHYVGSDGPVDLKAMSIFYTYGEDGGRNATRIGSVTFA